MSHRRADPHASARAARADSLETSDGILEHARVGGLDFHRDRQGNVLVTLGADPRGNALLDREQVARAHHALACALWPYGEKPEEPDA
ncbi:hypothetical protein QDA02_gp21 [Microbacterium phage Margaery]|uniref:Uncharacterized protein n=1 Tax=Microbacterium phage Margaery TaxID=2591217 RepID=A0A514DHR8_9CAUD|nr:hypothetical protein QDA02_gp21 [Microbacterium phage Margaery]QDH93144.1 hypothetical protein PBI_MARGAERY_87 [Microbacterium phage Margaery]